MDSLLITVLVHRPVLSRFADRFLITFVSLVVCLFVAFTQCHPSYSPNMTVTQLRSAGRLAQLAGHVNGARQFSTRPALRKEIQDAYILSAARTPTAKVRRRHIFSLIPPNTNIFP